MKTFTTCYIDTDNSKGERYSNMILLLINNYLDFAMTNVMSIGPVLNLSYHET